MIKLDTDKWIKNPFEFKDIDGWMWVKIDENHMERLPEEIYKFGEHEVRIPGSISKWLQQKLKEDEDLNSKN